MSSHSLPRHVGRTSCRQSRRLASAFAPSGCRHRHGADSLGLFQQRPSQGWGTPAQILNPPHAAASFYQHLVRVPRWEVIPVTDAAQRVQRSALPHGYAQFEPKARALAIALTGEAPAAFACQLAVPSTPPAPGALTQAMANELGLRTLAVDLGPERGWTIASWMVAHAVPYRIVSVAYAGQRWTAAQGTWIADASVGNQVEVVRVPVAGPAP